MTFRDAHCHLQDPRLAGKLDLPALRAEAGIGTFVVNGTREADWDAVARLAVDHPDLVIPSFGLHPWYVAERSLAWLEHLRHYLDAFPAASAGIGEIGLDRWIEGHDDAAQEAVFLAQLDIAARENRPVSIHCLRAWGRLLELLQNHPRPERGFLLHSYGGSAEMVAPLAKLGAHFSFCGYFLTPRKLPKMREVFRQVPLDRLLIETDAPDQALPENLELRPLAETGSGRRINHPANLPAVYSGLAEALDLKPDDLSPRIEANFHRLFSAGRGDTSSQD